MLLGGPTQAADAGRVLSALIRLSLPGAYKTRRVREKRLLVAALNTVKVPTRRPSRCSPKTVGAGGRSGSRERVRPPFTLGSSDAQRAEAVSRVTEKRVRPCVGLGYLARARGLSDAANFARLLLPSLATRNSSSSLSSRYSS
jgi:hypothetical protein